MAVTTETVQAALKDLIDPNTEKDYLSTRSAKNIKIEGVDVSLDIELGYPAKTQFDEIRRTVIAKLRTIPGIGNISANISAKIVPHTVQRGLNGGRERVWSGGTRGVKIGAVGRGGAACGQAHHKMPFLRNALLAAHQPRGMELNLHVAPAGRQGLVNC